jgi:hypothetical protein
MIWLAKSGPTSVICIIVVSITYCVVFLFCLSSSYVACVASFSGLSLFGCPFSIFTMITFVNIKRWVTRTPLKRSQFFFIFDVKWDHFSSLIFTAVDALICIGNLRCLKYGINNEFVPLTWSSFSGSASLSTGNVSEMFSLCERYIISTMRKTLRIVLQHM